LERVMHGFGSAWGCNSPGRLDKKSCADDLAGTAEAPHIPDVIRCGAERFSLVPSTAVSRCGKFRRRQSLTSIYRQVSLPALHVGRIGAMPKGQCPPTRRQP